MKTFKEYGLPPSAAKGAKAHTKPLPKKKPVVHLDKPDSIASIKVYKPKEEIERRADFQMTKKTMPDGSVKFVKAPKKTIEIGKGKNEKVEFSLPKVKTVTTKIDLKGLKKAVKFYDKPLKQKGYPEQENTVADRNKDYALTKKRQHDYEMKWGRKKDTKGFNDLTSQKEASLPPHLQIFNKHGNVDPEKVSQKVHQGKKAPKFTVTDVTPKGYGPKNEAKVKGNIYYKVNIEGLPPLYLPGEEGVGKIKAGLRKLLKRPDMVTDMERQTGAEVRKAFRMMGQGKEDEPLKHVREAIGPDDADDKGEYDYEGEMAKNQLNTMIDAAKELHDMLGDDDNLPEWVQSKITKATDYIDSVRDYLKSESES